MPGFPGFPADIPRAVAEPIYGAAAVLAVAVFRVGVLQAIPPPELLLGRGMFTIATLDYTDLTIQQ